MVAKSENIDFSDVPELGEEFWERAEVAITSRILWRLLKITKLCASYFPKNSHEFPRWVQSVSEPNNGVQDQ